MASLKDLANQSQRGLSLKDLAREREEREKQERLVAYKEKELYEGRVRRVGEMLKTPQDVMTSILSAAPPPNVGQQAIPQAPRVHPFVQAKLGADMPTRSGETLRPASDVIWDTKTDDADLTPQQAADKYKSLLKTEQKPGVGQWLGTNTKAGIGAFNRGLAATADWVLPDFLTPKPVQGVLDYYKGKGEQYAQEAAKVNEASNTGMVGSLYQGVVSAAPNAALAIMTAGGSLAAQAPNAAAATGTLGSVVANTASQMASKPTFWLSASRIVGQEYEDAKKDGASELEAQATGIISGLMQAGVEVSGGIEAFGKGAGGVRGWVKTMLDEGKEEVVQGVIENLTRKAMFAHDAPYASLSNPEAVLNPKRAAQEFAGGAVAGGILGGAQSGIAKLASLPRAAVDAQPNAPTPIPRGDAPTQPVAEPLKPATQAEAPILRPKGWENTQPAKAIETPLKADSGAQGATAEPTFGKNTVGAAESNPASYDAMQNRYGTIEPGELPHGREVDVPKSTDGQNKVRQYTRTLMEAPATPDEMIPLFEQHVQEGLFSYKPRKDAAALDAAVKSITDKGYTGALEQWNDVAKGHKVASKDDMVLGQMLYSLAAKNGDTETAMKLAAEIAAEGTRLGQGVQALRMLKKTTPEGKLYYMQKSVENIKQDLVKKYGKNAPDIKIDDSLVKNYSDAMKTGDQGAMDTALDAIEQHVADQIPATFTDKWNAWRYFSMLGNPRTHIRNVVGNALFYGTTKAKNGLAAAIEEGVDRTSRAMGRGGIERSKTLMKTPESVEFAKQDVTEMLDVLQGGGKYNPSDAIRDKRAIFNTKWLEKTRKGAMDALEAEDLWFLKPHYIDSMAGYLSANKIDPAKITTSQLETARSYAIKEAQRATFRDASAFASRLNKLSKTNAATHLIVEGIVPFKKTPINIAKRAVEYSPAGLIKFAKETLIDVPKGNKTAAEAIDTLASGLTGSAIMALGYWLASSGIITAGNDEDAKQQGFDNLTGGQNYALNIGNSSYTLDWAAPSAIPLFMGAEYFNRKGEDLSPQELINSLLRVGDPLVEMSMLQGLEGAIRTAAYSQSPIFDGSVDALASYVSQGVPTLFGQVARTIDDTRRITYVEKGDIKPISATLQKSQAKIPFASQGLTPRIDAWGREVKQQGSNALSRAAQNMLSPGYYSESKKTAVDSELERLYKQGVEHNPYPQLAARYFYDDGETINLTAKEWEAYAKEKGQQSLQLVTDIMETPYYKNADDGEKAKAISAAYEYANALAKSKVSDYELDGWMAKAQSSPVSVDEYIVQRNRYNDFDSKKDKDGKVVESASDQYRRALFADSSLSASEKASLDRDLTGSKNVPDYSNKDSFLLSQLTDAQQERYEKYNRDMLTAENYYEIVIAAGKGKTKAEKLERIEALGYSKQQSRQIYARILSK